MIDEEVLSGRWWMEDGKKKEDEERREVFPSINQSISQSVNPINRWDREGVVGAYIAPLTLTGCTQGLPR